MATATLTSSLEGIGLRRIEENDLPFLARVYASTREEELAVTGWNESEKEAFFQMQFEAQHKYYRENYLGADFLVILKDVEPIGRLYLARWKEEIRIVDIALLPANRNGCAGSGLMESILREAEEEAKRVTVHVERFNPALRFYDRLGFRQVEDKGVYLFLEWTPKENKGFKPLVSPEYRVGSK